jgi:hypothetical protein
MRALSRSLGFRLAALGVGIVGGMVWIIVDDDGTSDVRGASDSQTQSDRGRILTDAERAANADCVSVARWKRQHHGFPPPYLLVKPVGGGPVTRLPFGEGWRRASTGEVWTHGGCPTG